MSSFGGRLLFHLYHLEQNICQSLLVYFKNLDNVKAGFLKKRTFLCQTMLQAVLLLKLSDLNSIESEVHVKRLLLLGRPMTGLKISPSVKTLFDSRVNIYFSPDINSMGFSFTLTNHCASTT